MRPLVAACAAIALAALVAGPRAARADNRAVAAKHFAAADAAMNKKDYALAISEYKQAYAAKPAAAVLYNIGVCYQKLGKYRDAARYFHRYLGKAGNPPDRDKVLQRLGALKSMPSKVTVRATPAGATVFIDGAAQGPAPVTVTLEAGRHTVYAAQDGRTSPRRNIDLEYGEPATLALTLGSAFGILAVNSNVSGAELLVDGDAVGVTPFRGRVPAGAHTLHINKPGFRPVARAVKIPAEGSEVIRVNMVRVNGAPAAPPRSAGFVLGGEYGVDIGDSAGTGLALVDLGVRSASQRWEAGLDYGSFGTRVQTGVGVNLKFYLATHSLRPYLDTAFELGGQNATDVGRPFAFEFGAGLLLASRPFGRTAYAIEYFVEVDAQLGGGGVSSQQLAAGTGPPTATVPILAGLLIRTGG